MYRCLPYTYHPPVIGFGRTPQNAVGIRSGTARGLARPGAGAERQCRGFGAGSSWVMDACDAEMRCHGFEDGSPDARGGWVHSCPSHGSTACQSPQLPPVWRHLPPSPGFPFSTYHSCTAPRLPQIRTAIPAPPIPPFAHHPLNACTSHDQANTRPPDPECNARAG